MKVIEEIKTDVQRMRDNKVESFKYALGEGVYVAANKEYPLVHIRYYFQTEQMSIPQPTKKGIGLRLNEWDALVSFVEEVKKLTVKK